MSYKINPSKLNEYETKILQQLRESAHNIAKLSENFGPHINLLAEENRAIGKYIKILEKALRV